MQKCPTCPRCSGIFVVKDCRQRKKPFILSCGHTFCESCLHHLAKESRTSIACPTCKIKTTLPSGENTVKSLCPDRYIMGSVIFNQKTVLEQELSRLKALTESCGNRPAVSSGCSDSSQLFSDVDAALLCKECTKRKATFYCPKCDCNMCAVCCKNIHSLSRSLQLHVPVSINEDGEAPMSQMCKLHENRTVEYYCDDDETVICSRCVIMGTHKGHNISSIEDKNRSVIREMDPKLQMANHVHRRLKKIDGELKAMIPDYKCELLPVMDEMRSHFQQLHGLLQIREQQMEQEIVNTVKNGVGPFEKLRMELQDEYVQLGKTIKAAEKIMKNSDDVVVNAKEILDKLVHAKDIPCIIEEKPDGDSDVSIRFIEEPNLSVMLADYGKITGSIPQRFTMHTMREMPEKFSEDFEANNNITAIEPDNSRSTPRSITPLSMDSDMLSMTSEATSQSEDVIIEEEQEIVFDGGSMDGDEGSVKIISRKHNQMSNKPVKKSLPIKKRFKGQHENVFVTHIHSPCKFMVQLKSDSSKISVLSHSLSDSCNRTKAKTNTVSSVEVDDLVLAQYSLDGKWYRGRVKNVIEPEDGQFHSINVEVNYIDFGNTEVVNVQKLRKMQDKFLKHAEFAMECSLFNLAPKNKDGTWSVEAVKAFAKMVEGRSMILTVVREENNVMLVDLSKPADEDIADDRPMSVRDALVFMDLAKMESIYSLTEPYGAPAPKRNYLTPAPKDEGTLYCVKVIYAGTPDCFYVQELGEEINYLATMMAHIQDTYQKTLKDSWQIISPQVGMICVTKFSGDGLWYRARITDLPGNRMVTVQYVDYGNVETVDVSKLRKIIDSFIILPAQALCCSLTDVKPLYHDTAWSTEALQSWSVMVTMKTYIMKVLQVDRNSMSVVLREEGNDIVDSVNVTVVENGIAESTGDWSQPQRMTELSNQMEEYTPRLSYHAGSGSFPEPCDTEHQPVYWKSRNSRPVRRYEETKLTPPTSPDLSTRPSQTQPRGGGSVEKNTVAKRLLQKSPVKEPKKVVTEETQEKTKTTEPAKEVDVIVSHFVSPSEFYLQMSSALSGENGLESLMCDLNGTYNNSEMEVGTTWSKGKYCVAYSTRNARWYRAKIVKCFQKSLVEVFMLDYGFTEVVAATNLRQVIRQYRKQRCFAFLCTLADVLPTGGMKEWSKTACEYMQDQTMGRQLLLIKKGNPEDGKLPVDIVLVDYIEESALEPGRKTFSSLIEAIKERGLAIPTVKKGETGESEKRVFPVLYYKKAEAEVKTGDKVMPVYVDYDATIHCYTMEGDDIFQNMCDTMHQKFKDSDPHGLEQKWVKGQACAAFYSKDSQWHRAAIVEIEPSKIQVHFIDYGNSEWVGCDDVRADIAEFTDIPQQTFLCVLHDIHPANDAEKWDMTTLEFMHKELVNKYCYITIVEKFTYEDKPMGVKLELNSKDFGSYLVQHGLANRGQYITEEEIQSAQIVEILLKKNPYKLMEVPKVGEELSVLVTHVELPNGVYIQPMKVPEPGPDGAASTRNKQLDELLTISEEMNQIVHTLPVVPYPKPGIACLAQFSFDQCWYRAVVVCVYEETEQILVLFVDYGNSEITTINKLRAITPKFKQLPCQSLRCKLAGILPVNDVNSWTKEALMKMIACVSNKPLLAKFVKDHPVTIEVYEGSEDNGFVYQSVIDGGFVQHDLESSEVSGNTPTSSMTKIEYPTVTVLEPTNLTTDPSASEPAPEVEQNQDADTSEGTVITVEDSGKDTESKSWADMAENASSVDYNELPELDDSEDEVSSSPEKSNTVAKTETVVETDTLAKTDSVAKPTRQKTKSKLTPEERKRLRAARKVVVSSDPGEECFD